MNEKLCLSNEKIIKFNFVIINVNFILLLFIQIHLQLDFLSLEFQYH